MDVCQTGTVLLTVIDATRVELYVDVCAPGCVCVFVLRQTNVYFEYLCYLSYTKNLKFITGIQNLNGSFV